MAPVIDPATTAGLVTREVRDSTRDGVPTKIAVARRTYAAERADLWDALTSADRLPRWFLPVSGDLTVGGRYQLEGNAGGIVERCAAPEEFAVTWEFGETVSWLTVHLTPADDGTTLELVHEAPVDPDFWTQYGPRQWCRSEPRGGRVVVDLPGGCRVRAARQHGLGRRRRRRRGGRRPGAGRGRTNPGLLHDTAGVLSAGGTRRAGCAYGTEHVGSTG
jgi:uncharacterized protein YndB with AHSA1/START domain